MHPRQTKPPHGESTASRGQPPRGADSPVLSLVLPAYNEADHLGESLQRIHASARGLEVPFEILLIDDGSRDATWHVVREAARELPGVSGLRLSRNFGKEAAIAAGLRAARGAAVVVMDADLQHPPRLLEEMFRAWSERRFQVVNAVKRRRGEEGWTSRWGARTFYLLFERLTGNRLEGSSDFKLLDREVVDALLAFPERHMFFRGLVSWMGYRQTEIPFEVPPRAGGASKWSVLRLTRLAVDGIISFSPLPLHLVTLFGLLFLVFAVILAGHTLYVKLTGGAVEGFATVILLTLSANAVLMLSLGLLGEYLAKIYDELKHRPRFLISDVARGGAPAGLGNGQVGERRESVERAVERSVALPAASEEPACAKAWLAQEANHD